MSLPTSLTDFNQIWMIDFEFSASAGEVPIVVCLVAKEYFSKKVIRVFQNNLKAFSDFKFVLIRPCAKVWRLYFFPVS